LVIDINIIDDESLTTLEYPGKAAAAVSNRKERQRTPFYSASKTTEVVLNIMLLCSLWRWNENGRNRARTKQRIEKLEDKIRQKDEVLAELLTEHLSPKKNLGTSERLPGSSRTSAAPLWIHPQMVTKKPALAILLLLRWLRLIAGKYYDWAQRYGKINQRHGSVPRDFWLADWERTAILDFQKRYPVEGYRRLTYMMIDTDVVAVGPSSVFQVLRDAGRRRHHDQAAAKYTYARTWDPDQLIFWSPAEKASARLKRGK
jgi:hypothetical protein